jgi:hypothetical protein
MTQVFFAINLTQEESEIEKVSSAFSLSTRMQGYL